MHRLHTRETDRLFVRFERIKARAADERQTDNPRAEATENRARVLFRRWDAMTLVTVAR